jgi:hypothetical protein
MPKNLPPTSSLSVAGAPDNFGPEFEALYRDETPYPVHSTRYGWWCLVSAVQLASRHEAARNSPVLKAAIEFAEQLGKHIATTPALAQVMAGGWDQRLDEPRGPNRRLR